MSAQYVYIYIIIYIYIHLTYVYIYKEHLKCDKQKINATRGFSDVLTPSVSFSFLHCSHTQSPSSTHMIEIQTYRWWFRNPAYQASLVVYHSLSMSGSLNLCRVVLTSTVFPTDLEKRNLTRHSMQKLQVEFWDLFAVVVHLFLLATKQHSFSQNPRPENSMMGGVAYSLPPEKN